PTAGARRTDGGASGPSASGNTTRRGSVGRPSPWYAPAGCGRGWTARHTPSAHRRVAPPDRGESCHGSGRWSWRHRGAPTGQRGPARWGDSARSCGRAAPVPARERRNRAAVKTRLRPTDGHVPWSSSSPCAWCTPCRQGTRPLVSPLRAALSIWYSLHQELGSRDVLSVLIRRALRWLLLSTAWVFLISRQVD